MTCSPHSPLSLSGQISSVEGETATLSTVLSIGSGFVLAALEDKSIHLASTLLTNMVYMFWHIECFISQRKIFLIIKCTQYALCVLLLCIITGT